VLNRVLCFVVYTCFVFCCISAVLRDSCWFGCSVTATTINEDYLLLLVVVVYLFKQANKTCNDNIITSPTKPDNQKRKCPSCWPPIAQTNW